MKRFCFPVLLTILFVPGYVFAQNQVSLCPCDTLELNNGTTGNDIIETLCPGGKINANFRIDSDIVEIFNGNLDYQVAAGKGLFCGISEAGVDEDGFDLTEQQFQNCQVNLIRRCGLTVHPIPTLSEWGMIAAAGILGMIGLFFIARRKKATA